MAVFTRIPTDYSHTWIGRETRVNSCDCALTLVRQEIPIAAALHQNRDRAHPASGEAAIENLITLTRFHRRREIARAHVPGFELERRYDQHREHDQRGNEILPRSGHRLMGP